MIERFLASAALAASCLLLSPAARADDGAFELGARTGFTFPIGNAAGGDSNGAGLVALSDLFSGLIPLWLDAGYRFTPHIYLGAYFQYGHGLTRNCNPGYNCSGHDLMFGIDGRYHFLPRERVDPWVGVGVGYEVLSISVSGPGLSQDASFKGIEMLRLQGGLDFNITDAFHGGPFLAFSLGKYSSESTSGTLGGGSGDVVNKTFHELFTIGVRGAFAIQ